MWLDRQIDYRHISRSHLESAGAATPIVAINTVLCGSTALLAVVAIFWEWVVGLVVQVAITAEPAGGVILVDKAIEVIVNACGGPEAVVSGEG